MEMYIHQWKALSVFAGLNHKFKIFENIFVMDITNQASAHEEWAETERGELFFQLHQLTFVNLKEWPIKHPCVEKGKQTHTHILPATVGRPGSTQR